MTTPFLAAAAVRGYLELNSVPSQSKYTDASLGSNIRAAEGFLEQATGRWFHDRPAVTLTTTTQGQTAVALPGFRTISGITQQSVALVLDQSYYLVSDTQGSGLFTAVQLRGFGSRSYGGYLSNPEWFDRNLDNPRFGWQWGYSLPNDLVVTGNGGYTAATVPEPFLHAAKVLAAWYTKRPDSLLANVSVTPDGATIDNSALPTEVGQFIREWRLGSTAVVAVG